MPKRAVKVEFDKETDYKTLRDNLGEMFQAHIRLNDSINRQNGTELVLTPKDIKIVFDFNPMTNKLEMAAYYRSEDLETNNET